MLGLGARFKTILLLLTLSSCSQTVREYPIAAPQSALQQAVDNASDDSDASDEKTFEISDWWLPKEWWKLFNDNQLTYLVEKSLQNNPSPQIAEARIRKAYFVVKNEFAPMLPMINFEEDWNRNRLSKNGLAGVALLAIPVQGVPTLPLSFNLTQVNLNFLWNLDIWQKHRNEMIAALDEMQKLIWDASLTNLILSASVTEAYYRFQIDQAREEIAAAIVENRKKNYNFIEQRIANAIDNDLNLLQALNEVQKADEALTQMKGRKAIDAYQLQAYLADQFEDKIEIVKIDHKKFPKFPLPSRIPLDLLAHRPDIMAQIWHVEAAARKIRAARASFFPNINLIGYLGYQSLSIKKLFEWASIFGQFGPSIHLPLFQGGSLTATLGISEEDYNITVLEYNQMVLDAVKDVLTNVALLENYSQQLRETEKIKITANRVYDLTIQRVQHHLDSDLKMLQAEYEFLKAEDQEMIAVGETLLSAINLVMALGGGEDVFNPSECGEN